MDMLDQLRSALRAERDRGVSVYRLAANAGVDQGHLGRFLSGEKPDMNFSTAAKLLVSMGYEIKRKSHKINKAP